MDIIKLLKDAKEQLEDSNDSITDSIQRKRNREVIASIIEAVRNPLEAIEEHFKNTGRMVVDYLTIEQIRDAAGNLSYGYSEEDLKAVFEYIENGNAFTGETVAIAIDDAFETLFPDMEE